MLQARHAAHVNICAESTQGLNVSASSFAYNQDAESHPGSHFGPTESLQSVNIASEVMRVGGLGI